MWAFETRRSSLQRFFQESIVPSRADRMTWHQVAFSADDQIGLAEYTYRGSRYFHGVAIVRVERGQIAAWREYQYPSDQPWNQFVGIKSLRGCGERGSSTSRKRSPG
jgi:hypothetical protein